MKGELPSLTFKDKELNVSYKIVKSLNPKIKLDKLIINQGSLNINPKMNKLLWYLKDYDTSHSFIMGLHKYEKKLFMTNERDREYTLFIHILENLIMINDPLILVQYKQSKIEDIKSEAIFKKIGSICKDIINSLHPMTYKILVENSHKIFNKIKELNFV